jgi:hypothetical protein
MDTKVGIDKKRQSDELRRLWSSKHRILNIFGNDGDRAEPEKILSGITKAQNLDEPERTDKISDTMIEFGDFIHNFIHKIDLESINVTYAMVDIGLNHIWVCRERDVSFDKVWVSENFLTGILEEFLSKCMKYAYFHLGEQNLKSVLKQYDMPKEQFQKQIQQKIRSAIDTTVLDKHDIPRKIQHLYVCLCRCAAILPFPPLSEKQLKQCKKMIRKLNQNDQIDRKHSEKGEKEEEKEKVINKFIQYVVKNTKMCTQKFIDGEQEAELLKMDLLEIWMNG